MQRGSHEIAELVIQGGTIVVSATGTETDAIAIRDGRVLAHGAEARERVTADTRVVDLGGGTLIPGIGDGHAHPIMGGLEAQGPRVRDARDLAHLLEIVASWKADHPNDDWIVGASYDATFAPGGVFDATWLDDVTGDTPTVLRAWDYHTAWVNSAALQRAGIDASTPDPPRGRIVRRDDGSPIGTLQEAAAIHVFENIAPKVEISRRTKALEEATRAYAAQGTTWVQDAWVTDEDLEAYVLAASTHRLHTRVNLAFLADPADWRSRLADYLEHRKRVDQLGNARLTAHSIKFFVDGVVENHTAAMLEPYADRPSDHGLPNWSESELHEATRAFHEQGFQLHLHAIGDAAIRSALDAIEAAQSAHPSGERNHVIAHVAVLHPDDEARFAELGVIANFEPYWAQCDAVMRDLTIPHLGLDREGWQYRIGSVHRSGATISFGSDWPVTTKDWRPALATAVARRAAGEPGPAWLPDERIDVHEALGAYTLGIAAQARATDRRGSLELGNEFDAVWLNHNPLTRSSDELVDLQVHGTWISGEPVFPFTSPENNPMKETP